MVCQQLTAFLEKLDLLPRSQSGFRGNHSTETALFKVLSDILMAADIGMVSLLGLLDMSAAFDTVDHDILICRLETSFGIMSMALAWLRFFLMKRTQQVVFNGHSSSKVTVSSFVPQGSVLGPLLFLLYTADIPLIASEHRIEAHFYADDGQLSLFGRAGEAESMISRVTECIADINTWMSSNRLKFNSDKTQFIWLGSRYQRQKVDITSIQLGVKFQSNVNDLEVIIDDLLSMKDHVQRICQSSYCQLRQLRTVRKSLSMESCEALIHAFVSSRLDYCNSLLYGINKLLDMLQSVLRASDRLIFRKRKFDSISLEIRDKLH